MKYTVMLLVKNTTHNETLMSFSRSAESLEYALKRFMKDVNAEDSRVIQLMKNQGVNANG